MAATRTTALLLGGQNGGPNYKQHPPIGGTLRTSIAATAVALGALGIWGYAMPMTGGVVASGKVAVEVSRRSVQSRVGGTIQDLRVAEGTKVEKGDVVVVFDRTEAKAEYQLVDSLYVRALAQDARLSAEANDALVIRWPQELIDREVETFAAQVMTAEQDFFDARLRQLTARRDLLNSRIEQLNKRIGAITPQLESIEKQHSLTREEELTVAEMVERGYERRPRLLNLQKTSAALIGQLGALEGNLASMIEEREAARMELFSVGHDAKTEVFRELSQAKASLAELQERRSRAKTLLSQTEVVAPETGTIVDLKFFGEGGVVASGEAIFDLVPTPDALLVTAQVRPTDIDAVSLGQQAQVRLLAFNQRMSEPINGTVEHISADLIEDQKNPNISYYEVFVRLDKEELAAAGHPALIAGMPIDVVLTTEERTFLEYLLSPIKRSLFLGFREE